MRRSTKGIWTIVLITMLTACSGGGSGADTTKPVIMLKGNPVVYLQKGLDYVDPGAMALDNTDGDITSSITLTNPVDKDVVGDYTLTYSVKDSANNSATITRVVKVVYSVIKQTGQTKSYDQHGVETNALRDDGYYQSGISEDYHRNSDKIVVDYVTGLMWQDDQTTQHNYNDAVAYCEGLSLGGYNDWRLPAIKELANITLHGSSHTPSVFQSKDMSKNYWSITSLLTDSNQAWGIDFATSGTDSIMQKSGINNVRCVRGTHREPELLQRDNATGIVFDPNTGLEWQDNFLPSTTNWVEGISYCRTLSLDGSNWRMSNYNELYMLLDRTQADALDTIFENRIPSDNFLVTSTTYDGNKTNFLEIKSSQGDDKWYSKDVVSRLKCVRTKDMDMAAMALSKITDYASSNGSTPVPTVADYEQAGISGVTSSNLNAINNQIKNATEYETDTANEVQDIVNDTIAANIPMPMLTANMIDGTSGKLHVTVSNIDTTEITKINVYRNSTDDIGTKIGIDTFAPGSTTKQFDDDGLSGCHTYYYWVEACTDQSGTEVCRIDTTSSSAKTVPDAPMNLKTYANVIRALYIKWENNSDNSCTVKYHLFHRTSETGLFTQIPEINDLTNGENGATETNVNTGVYIHYRIQAEDAEGHKSSLSCSVADGYPRYGVDTPQDSCKAAVGYTWGDQPRYPWASYNGYTDQVIFTWDDVVINNSDPANIIYAENYRVQFKVGGGTWSQYYNTNNHFTFNNAQYQQFTITNVSENTNVTLRVSTHYLYDGDGDGQVEHTYSDPIEILGKTASSGGTGGTNTLGIPPAATASNYYPGKIMVAWTPTDNVTYYKLFAQEVSGVCPSDSNGLTGYSTLLSSTTATTFNHLVSWKKYCYRVEACNASGCGAPGPHAYGNSTGN